MNKNVVNGSIVLILSGLICKVLGAFFRIPLTTIVGVEGIGVFQMVMSLYGLALVLCSGGITATLSTLVSKAKAKGEMSKINSLYKISILFSLVVGFFIGLMFFIFSNQISSFQGSVDSGVSYKLMLFLLPLGGIIACFKGVIQGNEKMLPTAISQIIEQTAKFVLGLVFALVLSKYGVQYGVFGAFLGIVAGEIFSFVYLLICLKKMKIHMEGRNYFGFFRTLTPILIGGCVLPLVSAVDSFLVINRLVFAGFTPANATTLFGIQTGIVGTVLNLPLIISTSIAISILPSLSSVEDENEFFERFCKAFRILWILILPMSLGIVAVSNPLYLLLYPNLTQNELNYAINLTKISAISTILFAIMQILVVCLQARGGFWLSTIFQGVGGIVKIVLVAILCGMKEINIYGLAISGIGLSAMVCVCCLIKLRGKVAIPYFELFVPLFASFVMMMAVSKTLSFFSFSSVLCVLSGVILGIIVYFLLCLPCLIPILKSVLKRRKKKQA